MFILEIIVPLESKRTLKYVLRQDYLVIDMFLLSQHGVSQSDPPLDQNTKLGSRLKIPT